LVNSAIRSHLTMDAAIEHVTRLAPSLIAIDGLPCSGKSTMARRLSERLGAHCIELDDFVLPQQSWPKSIKPAFPFQYIRYGEFVEAVQALSTAGVCSFRPFDWNRLEISPELRTVTWEAPVIVEGVSSLNPILGPLFDIRIFIESDRSTVLQTATQRGVGPWEREWADLFLPSVDLYMATEPRKRADVWYWAEPHNNAFERTVKHRGPRLSATQSSWPAAQLGR
jgi:uridine kinase